MSQDFQEPRITLITRIKKDAFFSIIGDIRVIRGLILFCVLSLAGCGKQAPPTVSPVAVAPTTAYKSMFPPSSSRPKAEPNPATDKPDFVLSAQEFYDDYVRRGPDAKKKYGGKVVELTGTVKRTNTNTSGQSLVYLEAGSDPFGVMCLMKEAGSVSAGQAVKIRGFWPKDARTAGLADCVLAGR
jgi:hypothetical protein